MEDNVATASEILKTPPELNQNLEDDKSHAREVVLQIFTQIMGPNASQEEPRKLLWLFDNAERIKPEHISLLERNLQPDPSSPAKTEADQAKNALNVFFTVNPDLEQLALNGTPINKAPPKAGTASKIGFDSNPNLSEKPSQKSDDITDQLLASEADTGKSPLPTPLKPTTETAKSLAENILTEKERQQINSLLSNLCGELKSLGNQNLFLLSAMARQTPETPVGDEIRLAALETIYNTPFDAKDYMPEGTIRRVIQAPEYLIKNSTVKKINNLKQQIQSSPGMASDGKSSITPDKSPVLNLLKENGIDPKLIENSLKQGKTVTEISLSHLTDIQNELGDKSVSIIKNPLSQMSLEAMTSAIKNISAGDKANVNSKKEIKDMVNFITGATFDMSHYAEYLPFVLMILNSLAQEFINTGSGSSAGAH